YHIIYLTCYLNSYFFFSSRRRHTISKRDWSSDVCSSDLAALEATELMHWASWLPLIVLVFCTIFKIPAFIALALSSSLATMVASLMNGLGWADIWDVWFNGFTASTNFEPVNELLTRGGINSMLFTVSLVILALGFGGLLFVTGIVPSILAAFQEKLKKVRSIIISTAATAIGV